MKNLDIDAKVKLLYALSASIDPDFLIELEKQAEIELDDLDRIIKFKKNGGGLELYGEHLGQQTSRDELKIKKLMEFLAEKSKTIGTPLVDKQFLRDFKITKSCLDMARTLQNRYEKVKNRIFRESNFDEITKIRMAFVSGAKIPEFVLKDLRKAATVEVDEKRKITKYVANDGSLKLEGDHSWSEKRRIVHSEKWHKISQGFNKINDSGDVEEDSDEYSVDMKRKKDNDYQKEVADLLKFLVEKTKNLTKPLSMNSLAKNFKRESASTNALSTLVMRIRTYRQKIHKMDQFDVTTKVKMLFGLSGSISNDFLNELRKYANVEVDDKGRIKKYVATDGSLKLEGDHSLSAKTRAGMKEELGRRNVQNDTKDEDMDSEESDTDDEKEEEDRKNSSSESEGEKENGPSGKAVSKSKRVLRKRLTINNPISDDNDSDSDDARRDEDSFVTNSRKRRKDEEAHVSNTKQTKRMRRNEEEGSNSIDPIQEETLEDTIGIENDLETMDHYMSIDDSKRRMNEDYDIPNYQETVQNRQESFDEMDIDYSINRYSGEKEVKEEIDGFSFNSGNEFKTEESGEWGQNHFAQAKQENFEHISGYGTYESKQNPDPIKSEYQEIDIKMELDEIEDDTEKEPSENLKQFLKLLRGIVLVLDTPTLLNIQKRIENMIEMVSDDKTIPIDNLLISIESCLILINKNVAFKPPPDEESESLRLFLTHLNYIISVFPHPSFDVIKHKLKVFIEELSIQNKYILVDSIASSLDTTLNIIAP